MTNEELELKFKDLLKEKNYFTFLMKAKEFNKIYKKSEFYKKTHLPLKRVVREAKIWYTVNSSFVRETVQDLLDNISLDNVEQVLIQLGDVFEKENDEINKQIEDFKNLDIIKSK